MSTHFSGLNQETHSYHCQEIPDCLKSNDNPQSIKSRNRFFQVSSTSAQQSSGGTLLWNIAPSNYSITKGTMSVRLRCTVTGTQLTGADAAHSVGFSGPGGVNALFVPLLGNGFSLFQRITLYGSNSSVIAQHNYLNDEMNFMLMHNSNGYYLSNDAGLLMGVGQPFNYNNSGTSCQIDLVLPIPLSCFNSSTNDWPAYLMSSPLTLQIDLASVNRALYKGATSTITDFTVSQTYLLYQAVELPEAFISAQRQAVKSHPFVIETTNTMSVQVPESILTSYTLGLNASSIRGAAVLISNVANYAVGTALQYVRDTADLAATNVSANASFNFNGSGIQNQLYLDGNLVTSNIIDNPANVFAMLKQMVHHNLQSNVLFPSPLNQIAVAYNGNPLANFCNDYYAVGWDTTSFDQEDTIFGGVPCTNLNIQMVGYNASTNNYLSTIMVFYDVLVAFSEDGSISVKR